MSDTVLIAIISTTVALFSSIPGFLALVAQRRKTKAEAGKTEADAAQTIQKLALDLIGPYKERVDELEATMESSNKKLKDRIEHLENGLQEAYNCLIEVADCAEKLHNQLGHLNVTPACTPPAKEVLSDKKRKALDGKYETKPIPNQDTKK